MNAPFALSVFWRSDQDDGIAIKVPTEVIKFLYGDFLTRKFRGKTYVEEVKAEPDFYIGQIEDMLENRKNGISWSDEEFSCVIMNIFALSIAFPDMYSDNWNGVAAMRVA